MPKESSEDIIEESPEYTSKSEFSKPSVVLRAYEDTRIKRGKEMVKGGWNFKTDKFGNTIQVLIPDTRKEFISAMIALDICLEPDADEKYQKARDEVNAIQDKFFEKFGTQRRTMMTNPNGTTYWKFYGEKIIAENSPAYEQWIDLQVETCTKLFRAASKLISRRDYFKPTLTYG